MGAFMMACGEMARDLGWAPFIIAMVMFFMAHGGMI
jgi:hypothetical protein